MTDAQILGVTEHATKDEINRAFHKLAHQYHPDKPGGDEAKFKEISTARDRMLKRITSTDGEPRSRGVSYKYTWTARDYFWDHEDVREMFRKASEVYKQQENDPYSRENILKKISALQRELYAAQTDYWKRFGSYPPGF